MYVCERERLRVCLSVRAFMHMQVCICIHEYIPNPTPRYTAIFV